MKYIVLILILITFLIAACSSNTIRDAVRDDLKQLPPYCAECFKEGIA